MTRRGTVGKRIGSVLSALILFFGLWILAATPSVAATYTTHGCTLTLYNPDYASGKVIFDQKVVCSSTQNGFDLNSLNGWSTRSGYEDAGQHNTHVRCFTGKSCTARSTINLPTHGYYYSSAVTDYLTNPADGINGIVFQHKVTDWIG